MSHYIESQPRIKNPQKKSFRQGLSAYASKVLSCTHIEYLGCLHCIVADIVLQVRNCFFSMGATLLVQTLQLLILEFAIYCWKCLPLLGHAAEPVVRPHLCQLTAYAARLICTH